MTAKQIDDKNSIWRRDCAGTENRVEPLTIEEVRRRVGGLGLATPAEAETMVREDRDSR